MAFLFEVYVQPGAKNTEIVGKHGQHLKIRLRANPVDNQANRELINFFAKLLNIRKQDIIITRGEKSRFKTLSFADNPEIIDKLISLDTDAAN